MTGRRATSLAALGAAAVLVAAAAFAQTGTRLAAALTNCDTNTAALDSFEQEMLQILNTTRAANGLGALKASPNLDRAAAWKSEDQAAHAQVHSHTDSTGRAYNVRLRECGYTGSFTGENVAWGSNNAQYIFNQWMLSPGHKANILHSAWKVVGIGRAGGDWTMDFGAYDDTGTQPPATTAVSTTAPPPTPSPTATPSPSPVTLQPSRRAVVQMIAVGGD
jgi:uncharacterized protein YkwD